MSVDANVRERILLAVEEVRKAAAKHNQEAASQRTASVHQFPAKTRVEAPAAVSTKPTSALHLMLAKPHLSIW